LAGCRALLTKYIACLTEYRTLPGYRALLAGCRTLWMEYRAVLRKYRALLRKFENPAADSALCDVSVCLALLF